MEDDLQDKGFNEKEIKEIFELYPNRMDKSVYYKLGAYLIALYEKLWDGYKELDY